MEKDEWKNLGLPDDDQPLTLRKLPTQEEAQSAQKGGTSTSGGK